MDFKVLKKYFNSRLNRVLIRSLACYPSGKVVIIAEDGHESEYYLENCLDYSADYILCELQDNVEINVSKY